MAGKKGQKAWNKREEFEWRDIWTLSKTDLLDLAKYFKRQITKYKDFETAYAQDADFKRLYHKWLEISTTVFVKGIPQKIEADVTHKGEVDHYHKLAGQELDSLEAGILAGRLRGAGASTN